MAVIVRRGRVPLMALALVALLAGLWGGLIRLGLFVPVVLTSAAQVHGPLMVLCFLGTLISLERAVALGRWWSYAAPYASGLGGLATLGHLPNAVGPALIAFAGVVLLADHLLLHRLARSLHNGVMGLGALAWCTAAVAWLAGSDISHFAPLLAGFLVLTIVGERLELTRVIPRTAHVRWLLLVAIAVFVVGLWLSLLAPADGVMLAGVGLTAQALWLSCYDVARRTVRRGGVTRFMALALLAGYIWLAAAGVLWIIQPAMVDGPAYDAALHAVFLGFVMSMAFAHAPVIVPAVLRTSLPFRRFFYIHLLLLHVSLALRLLGGDLGGDLSAWRWGGLAGGAAILLFLLATAGSVVHAHRSGPRRIVHAASGAALAE